MVVSTFSSQKPVDQCRAEENKVTIVLDHAKGNSFENRALFSFDVNNLGINSNRNEDNLAVKSIKATSKKILFSRQDGMVFITNTNDLS